MKIVERSENGGTAAAANSGVAAATATFVAFLDSDDGYLPDHLELHLDALKAAPSSIGTYGDFFQVWGDYGIERLVHSRTVEDQRKEMLLGGFIYTQSLTVLRRQAILDAGGFDETYRISGDYDLWLRFALTEERPFVHVAHPTVRYYMSDDAVSTDYESWYNEYRTILEQGFGYRAALKYRHLRAEARHKIGLGIVARGELVRSMRNPPSLEVSVILRSNGSSSKLRRAVASIEAQTYSNFEIIVIDDAGDPESTRWLKRRGDDLKVMRFDKRQGEAASFNHGLFAASGSLIACLDVDDEWLPDYLLTQVRAYGFDPASPVFCSCEYYEVENGSSTREHVRHTRDDSGSDVLRYHLLNAILGCASFFRSKEVGHIGRRRSDRNAPGWGRYRVTNETIVRRRRNQTAQGARAHCYAIGYQACRDDGYPRP